jgi:hypothetical protein
MYDIMTRLKAILRYEHIIEHINRSLRQVARIHGVSKSSLQARSRWMHAPPMHMKRDLHRHRTRRMDDCRQQIMSLVRENPYSCLQDIRRKSLQSGKHACDASAHACLRIRSRLRHVPDSDPCGCKSPALSIETNVFLDVKRMLDRRQ